MDNEFRKGYVSGRYEVSLILAGYADGLRVGKEDLRTYLTKRLHETNSLQSSHPEVQLYNLGYAQAIEDALEDLPEK